MSARFGRKLIYCSQLVYQSGRMGVGVVARGEAVGAKIVLLKSKH